MFQRYNNTNMLKKIIYTMISLYSALNIENIFAASIQEGIKPWKTTDWVVNDLLAFDEKDEGLESVSQWIVSSIDLLLPITAVWVFLFVGIRLAMAQWKSEEFKKAWMQFMYAVIGIFIISFAWAAVKLVSGLNL